MRSINFKIWDSQRKKMYFLLENRFSFGTCESDRAVSWEDVFAEKHEELIPLQYTGLKDKNGVKIYEGDIFKENKSIGEIKYGDASFFIDWKIIKDFWSASLKHHAEHGEVIGNIYENADLLK